MVKQNDSRFHDDKTEYGGSSRAHIAADRAKQSAARVAASVAAMRQASLSSYEFRTRDTSRLPEVENSKTDIHGADINARKRLTPTSPPAEVFPVPVGRLTEAALKQHAARLPPLPVRQRVEVADPAFMLDLRDKSDKPSSMSRFQSAGMVMNSAEIWAMRRRSG